MAKEEKASSRRRVILAVALVVLLPVLYVLSIGPAYCLVQYGYVRRHTYVVTYRPIIFVCSASPSARQATERYLDFWMWVIEVAKTATS
jgi:hypothetical protein